MRNDRQPLFPERLPVSAVVYLGLWLLSASAPALAVLVDGTTIFPATAAASEAPSSVNRAKPDNAQVATMPQRVPLAFVPDTGQLQDKHKGDARP